MPRLVPLVQIIPIAAAPTLLVACGVSHAVPTIPAPAPYAIVAASAPRPVAAIDSVAGSRTVEEMLDCRDGAVSAATRNSFLTAVGVAKERWARTRPPRAEYQVSVGGGMIATPAYQVTLVGDSVVAPNVAGRPNGRSLSPEWLFAMDEAAARTPSGRVSLAFDERYGLPTLISIDPSQCVMDDRSEILVHAFTARPPRR